MKPLHTHKAPDMHRYHFAYFVHKTAGIETDSHAIPGNLPCGGFYRLETAKAFAASLADGMNFVSVYDEHGKLVKTFPPGKATS